MSAYVSPFRAYVSPFPFGHLVYVSPFPFGHLVPVAQMKESLSVLSEPMSVLSVWYLSGYVCMYVCPSGYVCLYVCLSAYVCPFHLVPVVIKTQVNDS